MLLSAVVFSAKEEYATKDSQCSESLLPPNLVHSASHLLPR